MPMFWNINMLLSRQPVQWSVKIWQKEYAYIWLSIKLEFSVILGMMSLVLDQVTQFIREMMSSALFHQCIIHCWIPYGNSNESFSKSCPLWLLSLLVKRSPSRWKKSAPVKQWDYCFKISSKTSCKIFKIN